MEKMKRFGGRVLFLDRDNINTDEIIPARYLTVNSKEELAPYLLEDLKLSGPACVSGAFNPRRDCTGKGAIVTRNNFGCGSSREHAPWALELNGIHIVAAGSFARIFRQNMYNCGLIAAELPAETLDALFRDFAGRETCLTVELPPAVNGTAATDGGAAACSSPQPLLRFSAGSGADIIEKTVPFVLEGFERALVESGGWIEYAARRY